MIATEPRVVRVNNEPLESGGSNLTLHLSDGTSQMRYVKKISSLKSLMNMVNELGSAKLIWERLGVN